MKSDTVIDAEYIKIICAAAALHNPVAKMTKRLREVLQGLSAASLRRPNDWEFQWTGIVEMRWYDGSGERLGGSTQNISLLISDEAASISGRMGKERYGSSSCGIRIDGMKFADAVKVLKILVDMIDATPAVKE